MIKKAIGQRIREIRVSRKVSQERLANMVGMGRTYMSELESGKRSISVVNLSRVVRAFDMRMAEFFDSPLFDEDPGPDEGGSISYYVTKL